MDDTLFHRVSRPLKNLLPVKLWSLLRNAATGFLMPVRFSWQSGHFRSSLRGTAVDREGRPIPWYTYPALQFLSGRSFTGRNILEFGAGNSTLWWAAQGAQVLALEGDEDWFVRLKSQVPTNVSLRKVSMLSREQCAGEVNDLLKAEGQFFDVIVVDGLYREQVAEIAPDWLKPDGAIICDDAESYDLFDILQNASEHRADFFGQAPGVLLPRATSIWFSSGCWLFGQKWPIRRIYNE